jgi:hypothetical protein
MICFAEAMPTSSGLEAVRRGSVLGNAVVCKTGGASVLVSVPLGRRELNPARPIPLVPTWEGGFVLIQSSRLGANGRLGQCLLGDLLHRLPLLLKRYPSYSLGLLVCGELPIGRRVRQVRPVRLVIRKLQTLTRRGHGHLSLHQVRATQISLRDCPVVAAVLAEQPRIHGRHPVGHVRIPIDVRDIDVVHDGGVVDGGLVEAPQTAVEASSPPAIEWLERSDRAPADSAESKSESEAMAKTDEGYQRRRPVVLTRA